MKKWSFAVFLWLALAYFAETVQAAEDVPPILLTENAQQNEDTLPVDEQIHERLEQFIKNCRQKKYAERLEKFSESD
ncbi:MAG: hypothetical protein LBP69_00815, partial [Treponema sp.]|nr:hypothetical protein [Treponema sp.]